MTHHMTLPFGFLAAVCASPGPVHAEAWTLPVLSTLSLSQNQLSGPLTGLCSLAAPKITDIDVSRNAFTGLFPSCLANTHPLLSRFQAQSNRLTGYIGVEFATLSKLSHVDVSNNPLSTPAWLSLQVLVVAGAVHSAVGGCCTCCVVVD